MVLANEGTQGTQRGRDLVGQAGPLGPCGAVFGACRTGPRPTAGPVTWRVVDPVTGAAQPSALRGSDPWWAGYTGGMPCEYGTQIRQLPAEVRTVTRLRGVREVHSRLSLRHSIYVAAPTYAAEFTDGLRRHAGTIAYSVVCDADAIERATALALLGVSGG